MTLGIAGTGAPPPIPGLSSDGQTPGGILIDGKLVAGGGAGNPNDLFHQLYGRMLAHDSDGANASNHDVLTATQGNPLAADLHAAALYAIRNGALNGHQYTQAVLAVESDSGGTDQLIACFTNTGQVVTVGHEGGLGLFGHTAPTAPRTLAQATITAITDANAKAAVQACANALSDMGVLTLT